MVRHVSCDLARSEVRDSSRVCTKAAARFGSAGLILARRVGMRLRICTGTVLMMTAQVLLACCAVDGN